MNINKAIKVAKSYLEWQKTGVVTPYNELNMQLLSEAIERLIRAAREEKELAEETFIKQSHYI